MPFPSPLVDAPIPLESLATPCAILDEQRMMRNIERLRRRLSQFDVDFRPHLKTSKCLEIARRLMRSPGGPAAVSTLAEAEQFAAGNVRDILYAVGVAPGKIERVAALRRRKIDLSVIIDSRDQARAVAATSVLSEDAIPTYIEIDCDGHRSGLRPDNPLIGQIARDLEAGGAQLRGVMTHAGGSYDHPGNQSLVQSAERERAAAVQAAENLRASGFECPSVSVGSTPTAHFAENLAGVTEVRAGVFVFFDLVMMGLGVCTLNDLALTVLATVIGHQPERGLIIVDAGWMALSRDRGTASQRVDFGYGAVCNPEGHLYEDLIVSQVNQEHGILAMRPESDRKLPELKVGSWLRIFPNHACATASQHRYYNVVDSQGRLIAQWPRGSGW